VTADLPERVWRRALMTKLGYDRNNSFEVIDWNAEFPAKNSSFSFLPLLAALLPSLCSGPLMNGSETIQKRSAVVEDSKKIG
jgi:hypothetical protein